MTDLVQKLVGALEGMLNRYVELVESGDAGKWDAEAEPDVIAARAILALRPQAVPMTDEQIVAAFKACDLEDPSKEGWIWRTRIKWARAIEAHHGITTPAGGEG